MSWRLKKTMARPVGFRPIEDEDLRYAWAAYKKGAMACLAPTIDGKPSGPFADTEMTSAEFDVQFQALITTRYHGGWTLFAQTKRGYLPVGIVLAFYSHADPSLSPFMIIGDIIWFPWASARNKLEAAVKFFADARHQIPFVDYAYGDTNRRFFETMAKHGIMRRVGTTYNVVRGAPVAIFETRTERQF